MSTWFINFLYFSDQLKALCKEYHARIVKIEGEKWDLEKETATKDSKVGNFWITRSNFD